jgi:hypothetical protein
MAAANPRPALAPRRRSDPRSNGTAGRSMNSEDHQEHSSHPETYAQPLVATVATYRPVGDAMSIRSYMTVLSTASRPP